MSESNEWQIQDNRVYRNGHSYTCPNIITAKDLQGILNEYETYKQLNTNIEQQYDNITRQLIQIKLNIGTLTEEVQRLEEDIQCLSK